MDLLVNLKLFTENATSSDNIIDEVDASSDHKTCRPGIMEITTK